MLHLKLEIKIEVLQIKTTFSSSKNLMQKYKKCSIKQTKIAILRCNVKYTQIIKNKIF